jgi:hypothetical protein
VRSQLFPEFRPRLTMQFENAQGLSDKLRIVMCVGVELDFPRNSGRSEKGVSSS